MTPHSVLAVTDFPHSETMRSLAQPFSSAEHGATLNLVYLAYPREAPPEDASTRLAHHALQLSQRHGVPVRAVSRLAFTVRDLLPQVASADLVVLGHRRRSKSANVLHGPAGRGTASNREAPRSRRAARGHARLPQSDRGGRLHAGVTRACRPWLCSQPVGPGRALQCGQHSQRREASVRRGLGSCHQGLPQRVPALRPGQDVLADGLVRLEAQSRAVRRRPR